MRSCEAGMTRRERKALRLEQRLRDERSAERKSVNALMKQPGLEVAISLYHSWRGCIAIVARDGDGRAWRRMVNCLGDDGVAMARAESVIMRYRELEANDARQDPRLVAQGIR